MFLAFKFPGLKTRIEDIGGRKRRKNVSIDNVFYNIVAIIFHVFCEIYGLMTLMKNNVVKSIIGDWK